MESLPDFENHYSWGIFRICHSFEESSSQDIKVILTGETTVPQDVGNSQHVARSQLPIHLEVLSDRSHLLILDQI
jgi:hypothetical protein